MVWELFYPENLATKRSTLQCAANRWHPDKTTRLTDFHSLKDLIIHSYRARVVAIRNLWIQDQESSLKLHDNRAFGGQLSKLISARWMQPFEQLDCKMIKEAPKPNKGQNNHWNNYVRFCNIMEPYMTVCSTIKKRDIDLLRNVMREVAVIFQASAELKRKYARAMLRQQHIFDTKTADLIFQEAYLANVLVNPRGGSRTFYKMDLLLKHQNGEFKCIQAHHSSFLQNNNKIF